MKTVCVALILVLGMVASQVAGENDILQGSVAGQGCLARRAEAEGRRLLGAWVPECESDGTYAGLQTQGRYGICRMCPRLQFCVDVNGTTIVPPTQGLKSCACPRVRNQTMQTSRGLIGKFIPTCDADGTFTAMQIHGSTGYVKCFSPDGEELTTGRQIRSCTCPRARFAAQRGATIGQFVAQCDATTGAFISRQRNPSTGYSWCVDQEGKQIGEAVSPAKYASLNCA